MMHLGRLISAAALACCCAGCGGGGSSSQAGGGSSTNITVTVPAKSPAALKLGVNVNTLFSWDGSRPFMNLIYGSSWSMQNTAPWGPWEDVPASSLDANGWVKSVPAGYQVVRGLSVPLAGGNMICRYQGNGNLNVSGPVSNVSTAPGVTRFTIAATYPDPQTATLSYSIDPANYIRNIDCREAAAATSSLVAPEFASAVTGLKVMRFMKWQPATEGNYAVTWATRNKPGDADYTKNDGVPVEVMVQLANEVNVDPWFTIPWNADDDYITRFATYVRDNLAPGHVAYVEVSNEVWNGGYPVAVQAANEAKAENLPSASGSGTGGNLERYAEKTRQVMQIWSTVFAGQMNRLVRVAAFQHVQPALADTMLGYQDLASLVDALATAPYFGWDITGSMTFDQIMAALPDKVTETVNLGVQQRAVAQKHGLRYIAYEGGQSIVLGNNLALEQQVERDPRMGDAYTNFIQTWQSQVGDTLTLFALSGPVSQYGSWGISEYVGQPVADAPKAKAVQSFLH